MISLEAFWNVLCRHDWYFEFSDDFSVWKRGAAAESQVKTIASQSDKHQQLFEAFHNYNFGGASFGTNRPDEPQKSDFNI